MSDLERELEAIDRGERCEVDGCLNLWSFCDVGEGGLYLCDEHTPKREAVMSERAAETSPSIRATP